MAAVKSLVLCATVGVVHGAKASYSGCDYVVVGGGISGMAAALEFADHGLGSKTCVFEADDRLGGRFQSQVIGGKRVPLGGIRVDADHSEAIDLAARTGVVLTSDDYLDTDIIARGLKSNSEGDFETKYDLGGQCCGDIYDAFLNDFDTDPANAAKFSTMREYVSTLVSPEAQRYIQDMFRFRADWASEPVSYLEFLLADFESSGDHSYPVGTWSAIIEGAATLARGSGVRIFTKTPVLSVNFKDGKYTQTTNKPDEFQAKAVILAVPPTGLAEYGQEGADSLGLQIIEGNVATSLRSAREYQALQPVEVVVIAQVWNTLWWKDLDVSRAFTTESCITFTELPVDDYAEEQYGTRSVYSDDPECTAFWRSMQKAPKAELEAYLKRNLEEMFGVEIPTPVDTVMRYWPNAWHFHQPGTHVSHYEVMDWAKNPIGTQSSLALAGEAYHLNKAWGNGAIQSAKVAVNQVLGSIYTPLPKTKKTKDHSTVREKMRQGKLRE
jgi:monoamine oxidase